MSRTNNRELIVKKILSAGTKTVTFNPGTKVNFHFKTTKCDENETVIDDSRVLGRPMELVLGKKFKLEVWETIVQKMALNEVSKFTVDKSLVTSYPFVSKTLREVDKPQNEKVNRHCCGVTLQNEGCKLLNKEYYNVIEHCTTVLENEPDNVKALFRRGKAHIGAWNQVEATKDLERAVELDPTLKSVVEKELQALASAIKKREQSEKQKYTIVDFNK
ncbi:Similar to AIP: AH receptor-interacting protein (Bos taurus) [Cotesia congregata]|uniref:Similar to AIP: AH receptor-interacting protein (Bos taurus) n=1 Tax=Cotesia congregata TaxID=51543 RepID=A0A8J2H8V6_COTCN|nr:Similar to AIP: AH receptor-interacting protein (Bos taurus) [Cotesia congregata]